MKIKLSNRMLEMIPGMLTLAFLFFPVIFSFIFPPAVVALVLIFDLYWLFNSVVLVINVSLVYNKIRQAKKNDWLKKINSRPDLKVKFSKIKMAIILVHYNEPYKLVRESVASYAHSNFPMKKVLFIMASEKREAKMAKKIFKKLRAEFGSEFGLFHQTIHPDGLKGEIPGKSSNETWGGRWLKKYCDKWKIPYRNVLLNNFDADTRVYPQYFAHFAYKYLTTSRAEKSSFQPIHIYENNIWETNAIIRVIAMSATMIYMSSVLRPFKFHNFSSRSDAFQTVVDINFWDPDIIPEDQRQYFKTFFKYGGKNKIIPLDVPLRMDAVYAGSFSNTMRNQYNQLRRWAWGVSDFPFIVRKMFADRKISSLEKLVHLISFMESHLMWAIGPIYISIVGWLPIILNPGFRSSVLAVNFPYYSRYILSIALIGIIMMIIIGFLLLPPPPRHRRRLRYFIFVFQWVLAPFASIFITSLAAIDAQMRLLLAKRLDYQVTEKKVPTSS